VGRTGLATTAKRQVANTGAYTSSHRLRAAVKVNFAKVPSEDFLERFSKFDQALRVLAYVLRFIQRCRKIRAQLIDLPRKRSEKLEEPSLYMVSGKNIPKSLNS